MYLFKHKVDKKAIPFYLFVSVSYFFDRKEALML